MNAVTTWLLGLLGLALLLRLSLHLGRWAAARRGAAGHDPAGDDATAARPDDRSPAARWVAGRRQDLARRAASLPLLPDGHRPPPGLGPLSPSERFLSTEAARGLRELQAWLLDPA